MSTPPSAWVTADHLIHVHHAKPPFAHVWGRAYLWCVVCSWRQLTSWKGSQPSAANAEASTGAQRDTSGLLCLVMGSVRFSGIETLPCCTISFLELCHEKNLDGLTEVCSRHSTVAITCILLWGKTCMIRLVAVQRPVGSSSPPPASHVGCYSSRVGPEHIGCAILDRIVGV